MRFPIFLVLSLSLAGCAAKAPPAKRPPSTVSVVEVKQRDLPIYGEWVGSLDGMVNAKIKAQVSSYLVRQVYKEGSFVRRGQLLFELDTQSLQASEAQAEGQLAQTEGQLQLAYSQQKQAAATLSQAESQMLQARASLSQALGQQQQAVAAVAQAQANQGKAQLDEDRYRPLAEKKAVTQQELDNAVQANKAAKAQVQAARAQLLTATGTVSAANAQIDAASSSAQAARAQQSSAIAQISTASAQVASAQANVRTANLNLDFTRIVSPIDGLAGVARAQVGDLISPTGEPLTLVSSVDPIKMNFTVPEQEYIEDLRRTNIVGRREAALEKTRFELVLADGSKYPQTGRFFSEDRDVALTTGAIKMTVIFPNPRRTLRPGQYARIRAVRYIEKGALLVPQRAVAELQDRYQVAVVGPENKISFQTVEMGERIGTDWVVKKGLKPGQTVVVEGLQKIGPGAVVNPTPYSDKATEKASDTPAASPTASPGQSASPKVPTGGPGKESK
jgi:RND family efflux transporter MFP subunit